MPASSSIQRQDSVLVRIVVHCLDVMKINGSDREQLLSDAGVPANALAVLDGWLPVGDAERLLHAFLRRNPMPAPALTATRRTTPAPFGVLGYLAQTCSDLQGVIAMIQRYERLISDIGFTSLRHEPGRALWCWDCKSDDVLFVRHMTEFILAECAAITNLIGERGNQALLAVHFRHALAGGEGMLARYEEHFRCPVLFGQPESALVLSHSTLGLPLRCFNADLREVLDQHASSLLTRRDTSTSLLLQARAQLLIMVREGNAVRERLAEKFGMSGRTLLRQLDKEGTNYHDLLDEVRLELAREYLLSGNQTIVDVSRRLNFRESHTFIRWFKRLNGCTPGEFQKSGAVE